MEFKDALMVKFKYKDFKELGRCEVYTFEEAKEIIEILTADGISYNMKFGNTPIGTYWYFEKA